MRSSRGLLIALLASLSLGAPASAQSIYSWVDKAGNPHVAESLREVPAAYRNKVKVSRIKGVSELQRGSLETPPPYQKSGGFVANVSSVRLLVFTATWCGYCARLQKSGKLEAIARTLPSLDIERVDLDTNKDRAQRYRVTGVPTLVVVDRSGAELGQLTWTESSEQLTESIKRYAARAN